MEHKKTMLDYIADCPEFIRNNVADSAALTKPLVDEYVSGGSQFQAQHLVKHLALGGKHNNRHLRFFPDFTADLPAVQLGQHNIQQNQFRVLFFIELHKIGRAHV